MVRQTATDGQMGSQSHEERSLYRSEDSLLPDGGNLRPSRRLGSHAYNPRMEGWPGLLEEFDVQFLMLDKDHDAELLGLFQAHPSWAIDSQDDQSVLLARTDVRRVHCHRQTGGTEMTDKYDAHDEVAPMKPSQSAGFTTFCRACANKQRDARLRGPDHLAKVFHVGWPTVLLATSWLTLPIARRVLPGIYEYLFARTEFFDKLFKQALEDNWPQIVLLGAGCDSRPYRFESLVKDTTIYEVDHPATQQVKRELLTRGGITVPESVRFVAADLNNGLLSEVLASHGLHRDQRTLFLMEGVIYFLTAEGVDSLLQSIRNCSPVGSGLAFDYILESMIKGTCDEYGAQQAASRIGSGGEVFRFGIDDHELESFLGDRGYRLIRQLTPEDLEARYLVRDGHPARGKIAGFYSIAQSVIC